MYIFFDFGTAKVTVFDLENGISEQNLCETGYLGTPYYMAPEVMDIHLRDAEGKIIKVKVKGEKSKFIKLPYDGFQADLWSFAVMLFEIWTGKRPFEPKEGESLRDLILNDSYKIPDLPEDAPEFLLKLHSKLMVRDPKKRWTLERALEFMSTIPNGEVEDSVVPYHSYSIEDTETLLQYC
jgi:serine/threonine protein kinase